MGGVLTKPKPVPAGSAPAGELDEAARSSAFRVLVRVGFLARAWTYGVVGALAIALAAGAGTGRTPADQHGALSLVAGAPLGFLALTVIAFGLLAYAAWKLFQGIRGRGPEGGGDPSVTDRIANLGAGAGYLAFFAVAVRVLFGGDQSGSGASGSPQHAAAGVLGWPGGRVIVAGAGVVLVAIAAGQAYGALTERFMSEVKSEEMTAEQRRVFVTIGRAGLLARSSVFVLCGYFLIRTAIVLEPASAVGVDGALERLHHQAFGPWIVGLVGAGLLLFAGYSLLEARYRRL